LYLSSNIYLNKIGEVKVFNEMLKFLMLKFLNKREFLNKIIKYIVCVCMYWDVFEREDNNISNIK